MSLVIGTGAIGVPTNGKAANTQPLNQPAGLALDAKGNLYVSDRGGHRIYQIDSTGVVTKIAGIGNGRFTGDGRDAVYAELNSPRGLTIGPDGNLYVADTSNQRIRKIDLASGIITTVAGSLPRLIRGRWRQSDPGPPRRPRRRSIRSERRYVDCRYRQQSHPQGGFARHHHQHSRARSDESRTGTRRFWPAVQGSGGQW